MTSAELARLWRTIRHLKPSQLFWRVRYQMERRRPASRRWRWTGSEPPRVNRDLSPGITMWTDPDLVALLESGTFKHLNCARQLGREHPDWCLGPVTENRLWVATLHYHSWAYTLAKAAAGGNQRAGDLFRHYLSDWITHCALDTPGARDLAWNSYMTATRIGWWVRSYAALGTDFFKDSFGAAFLSSLWEQAGFLADHIEWDLCANHLLRDAAGLAWAGRFFDEPQAKRWMSRAAELAVEQAAEQVLPDGGHFERSPMYHLHTYEDLLVLTQLLERHESTHETLKATWARMADFARWLSHPDGLIPLLNDAAMNATLPERAKKLDDPPRGGRYFSDMGLAVWHGTPWTVFFDVGPVGPDYQPGHAHADTLTIEASYKGKRLFVDPGTFGYDNDERRRYDRSTAAHNTVCIDGEDSSEMWHIFRVGRRAKPLDARVEITDGGLKASGGHNGYDHLRGWPRHSRRIEVSNNGLLIIADSVHGGGVHKLEGGLLVAPGWEVKAEAGGWRLHDGKRSVRVTMHGPEAMRLSEEKRPYHPEFGLEIMTPRLCWEYVGALPVEIITRVDGA